jgi:exosortase
MAALGVSIYGKALYALGALVFQRYGSSHGLFVPFISGYLVWLKLDDIKRSSPKAAPFPGAAIAAAGVVLLIIGHGNEGIALPVLSLLSIAAGLILVLFGGSIFKEIAFPLFFLGTMIPLSEAVYSRIADLMRQATTWGSVGLVKFMGVPLFRDGFDIYLPNSHLVVGHSCSGIRYLLSYIVFAVAYAYCFKKNFSGRALVVMSAVPLSILGGIFRLSVIFFTGYHIGPIMVKHVPHVILSWSVFTVLLVSVIIVDQYMSRIKRD